MDEKHRFDPNKHHRRSIRLKEYDYSQEGLYFITICVRNMHHLFGDIEEGVMFLNDAGKMVEEEWLKIDDRFGNVRLHEYVVMPNHFHSILEIVDDNVGQPQGIAPTDDCVTKKTVGDMVGAFQSIVTVEYIRGVKNCGWKRFDKKLWQRNYWEHIIRNEKAYQNISNYIINNPKKWTDDRFYT